MIVLTRNCAAEPVHTDADQATSQTTTLDEPTRRGTTVMEYLVMISMIIVVCLAAIGYLGGINNNSMSNSSGAISKAMKGS
jgi:hypothetical protein